LLSPSSLRPVPSGSLSPIRTPPRALLFPSPHLLPDLVALAIPPSAARRAPPSRSGAASAPRFVVGVLAQPPPPSWTAAGVERRSAGVGWLALDWSAGWLVGRVIRSFAGEWGLFVGDRNLIRRRGFVVDWVRVADTGLLFPPSHIGRGARTAPWLGGRTGSAAPAAR